MYLNEIWHSREVFRTFLARAEKEQHLIRIAADCIFSMLQQFVHSKAKLEASNNCKIVMAYMEKQFDLLPLMTQSQLERERDETKITISRTKQSAWAWFRRTVVGYILDRGDSVCLYAFIRAGLNISGRRGPAIESYNMNQKFYLGKEANHGLDRLLLKVCVSNITGVLAYFICRLRIYALTSIGSDNSVRIACSFR